MRYQVRFDDRAKTWMVIDTRVGGKIVQRHNSAHEAKNGAWNEEERWYKCSGEGYSEILVGVG